MSAHDHKRTLVLQAGHAARHEAFGVGLFAIPFEHHIPVWMSLFNWNTACVCQFLTLAEASRCRKTGSGNHDDKKYEPKQRYRFHAPLPSMCPQASRIIPEDINVRASSHVIFS